MKRLAIIVLALAGMATVSDTTEASHRTTCHGHVTAYSNRVTITPYNCAGPGSTRGVGVCRNLAGGYDTYIFTAWVNTSSATAYCPSNKPRLVNAYPQVAW